MVDRSVENKVGQAGRRAVVTGTGGLGFQTALALAKSGWTVVVAGRDFAKGVLAVAEIKRESPQASVVFEQVDLADLRSIAAFGQRMNTSYESLDLLINNAGVMTPPTRRVTADGFELQFGVNYLGHFALTAHLLPLLRRGLDPRVINVSSIANRNAELNFGDLQFEREYKAFAAYSQSKLAQLMFTFELQRRSDAAGWGIQSVAAHPGLSRTDLIPNGSGNFSFAGIFRKVLWFTFQPASQGALPTLFAATSPSAKPAGYYGPDKLSETRGNPAAAKIPMQAADLHNASHLWDMSQRLAGVRFGEDTEHNLSPRTMVASY